MLLNNPQLILKNDCYIWGLKVAVAAGAEDRGEERMWSILSRSLLRSFTMELPRSSLFLVISFVPSAVGQ
jgi:hypothetical protein